MSIYPTCPERLAAALRRYVDDRIATGGFLKACLENDLLQAACTADDECRLCLPEIMRYIANELPSACWGSRYKVKEWLRGKRAQASA